MRIAIRKEPSGSIYIDKTALEKFSEEDLRLPPYNYSIIEIEDVYIDVEASDFDEVNGNFIFNVDRYNRRKLNVINQIRIAEIQIELDKLSQDIVQVQCGAVFEDLTERKQRFATLHNELRQLLGKEPRVYEEG